VRKPPVPPRRALHGGGELRLALALRRQGFSIAHTPRKQWASGRGAIVNEPRAVSDEARLERAVFISYATADRKEALAVCKALEGRGTRCWISTRDVAPGENYQEAIVRSLRDARA